MRPPGEVGSHQMQYDGVCPHKTLYQQTTMSKKGMKKRQRFADVPELVERVLQEAPPSGEYFYDYKLEQAKQEEDILNEQDFHRKYKINFDDLPISQACIKGLHNRRFTKMTQIQRCVIPHALADRDILAASKTGSGKTLCYLIPLIEKLYRHKFIPFDGLGALVILPTRELAMQVFEVLNSFTSLIQISVGLIIGGKSLAFEKEQIRNMNILICTPGRLLQHLEETYGFETTNLQMLVLDEADIMLQMGFQEPLKVILEHLPKCQTMLFSATLNTQIHLLASMSMSDPEKIFLHSAEGAKNIEQNGNNIYETPAKLTQYYLQMRPEQKINTLYSFLKTHQREKIIVFVSTCKQVRFIYESFKKFRLGLPMYELQGHQKQKKRMAIYFTFCEKKYGLLVCTNIASRGLDFPKIDWVVQFDIPEDTETYVHRIGRTARFKYEGKALTFVTESETKFVDQLKSKNVHIHKIKQNPEKYFRIESSLQSICSEHQDVKYLAQRALISYLKFVHKASNKSFFNIKKIDAAKLAESFGLQNAPVINIKQAESEDEQEEGEKLTKIQKLRQKTKLKKNDIKQKKQALLQKDKAEELGIAEDDEDDDGLLRVKETHKTDPQAKKILTVTKNRMKKIRNEGLFEGKNKIHFDDELNPIDDDEYLKRQYLEANEKNIEVERDFTGHIDKNKEFDEQYEKERRKQKRRKATDSLHKAKGDLLSKNSKLAQRDRGAQLGSESEEE